MRKILFFSCIILVVIFGYVFFGSKPEKKDNALFVVGTAGGYAPFVSQNERGEYEGFDIDVAQKLSEQMGKRLEIQDLGSMTTLFIALQQDKIDVIIWALSIIPERLEKVAMVQYQGDTIKSYKMLFWKQIPEGITSIEDLKGKVVCVEVGTAQEKVLTRYPHVIQKPLDKVTDALMEIQYSKADAAFVEPAVARKFQEKFSEIKLFDVPLKKEDQEFGTGIAIKKDRPELIEQIKKAVAVLKQKGVLDALESKWGLQ